MPESIATRLQREEWKKAFETQGHGALSWWRTRLIARMGGLGQEDGD
jgi:hypothetical protein